MTMNFYILTTHLLPRQSQRYLAICHGTAANNCGVNTLWSDRMRFIAECLSEGDPHSLVSSHPRGGNGDSCTHEVPLDIDRAGVMAVSVYT